ncbi:hypothetical protein HOLleu_30639 [Holothuria leucospilota]|uniref:Uncharacterized protein n=1 Tax=Holothuria leucospilota TaxID=206669 RepID=A0A9Q1BKT8_HOLLE|nr:hypothetical protein HOLleu_30639 [Holothuria leucospilota]
MTFTVGFTSWLVLQIKLQLPSIDKSILGSTAVGSHLFPGIFAAGSEAGTVRLIRLICKSIQQRACEKSGKPVDFLVFLKSSGVEKDIPLAPFKGNRFNILFHNAIGLSGTVGLFKQVEGDNQLMKVVHADLEVSSFKSGCRALGIIDKMITAPLWKCLNETGADGKRVHVADMSSRNERFMECCEKWVRCEWCDER